MTSNDIALLNCCSQATFSRMTMLPILRSHPRLSGSIIAGMLAGAVLPLFWNAPWQTHVLAAWSMGAVIYLLSEWRICRQATPAAIRRRARRQAEGRGTAMLLALAAIVVALVAVVTQLAEARNMLGWNKAAHMGLAMLTVGLAWVFIHSKFALLYAHDYYQLEQQHGDPGLQFPGSDTPGYLDFFYFAFIIATSGQTADVSFTSTTMRRTGLLHCVLAYGFNAIVLALMINIASSLF